MENAEKFIHPQLLSDSELYQKCQQCGAHAKVWKRRFAGMLPEVAKRQLHRRRGFESLQTFAAKLAGMSHAAVDRVLRLDQRLRDKPKLHELFLSGSIGWTKLEHVSYRATAETDGEWAEKVQALSLHALIAYIQERKRQEKVRNEVGNDPNNVPQKSVFENTFDDENALVEANSVREPLTLFSEKRNRLSFPINPDIEFKLKLIKQRLEKEKGMALTFNEVLAELIKIYDGEMQPKTTKAKVIQICPTCVRQRQLQKEEEEYSVGKEISRNIPAAVKHLIDLRSQGKCEFPACKNPSETYQHVERFALDHSHDPEKIRAVCIPHERLMHAGMVENENMEPLQWKIRLEPNPREKKFAIDEKVAKFRIRKEPN